MVDLDWANLSFKARPTNAIVVSFYRDGQWSIPEVTENFNLTLSSFAGVFHYASACIEGLKAFRGIDGKVRIFRPFESEILTKSYTFGAPDKCGAVSQKLYNFIRDIQEGSEEDIHNWCLTVR